MTRQAQNEAKQGRGVLTTLASSTAWALGHLILSALCLLQWHSTNHWSAFDRFAVTYLVIKLLGSLQSLYSGVGAFRSERVRREWWGLTSDANIVRSTQLLMVGDLLIFYDYAHWQTLRCLALPCVQVSGLVFYVVAKLWQMWTDSYLAGYFMGGHRSAVMTRGPFRLIRHPRYAAVMLGKLGCALIFASVFGWILFVAWCVTYARKVMREEVHLREVLGEAYGEYSGKTARLIPGVY